MARLTKKQRLFIASYLGHFNATRAAIDAGYSPDTAYSIGHENLKKPEIRSEIRRQVDLLCRRFEVTQKNVLSELAAVGFDDIRDVGHVGENGEIIAHPTIGWTDPAARSVRELRSTKYGPVIKQHDKLRALELLGRYLGLWSDQQASQVVSFTLDLGERPQHIGSGSTDQD